MPTIFGSRHVPDLDQALDFTSQGSIPLQNQTDIPILALGNDRRIVAVGVSWTDPSVTLFFLNLTERVVTVASKTTVPAGFVFQFGLVTAPS